MDANRALEAHPAALIFPLMEGESFVSFCKDIQQNGQQEPIVLYDGKILDGRNRFNACRKVGVNPLTVSRIVEDPLAFVVSANLHRRQLTPSQLAMVGADVKKLYEVDAKERQRASGGDKKSVQAKSVVATLPQPVDTHKSRDKAAKAVGVSPRSVQAAAKVVKDGCDELNAAVREGRIKVRTAEQFATMVSDKNSQAAIVRGALSESDPNKALREHAAPRPRKADANEKPIPKVRVTSALASLEDLENRLDRLGVLSVSQSHVNAIKRIIENVI